MVQWLESWLPADYLALAVTQESIAVATVFVASVSALYAVDMLIVAFSKIWKRK